MIVLNKLAQLFHSSDARGSVIRFKLFIALALFLISIPAMRGQQAATEPLVAAANSVGLQPGDLMDAHFIDFPEIGTLHLVVSPSGTLFVPYVGEIKVQGMEPEQAEQAITEALQAKQIVKSPQVSLTVTNARNLSVMVLGAVTVPHQVPLFAPAPLSYVLAQVGPITVPASYHVLVAHRDGSAPADVELEPG
jgi:protein involved in polysaccharide export with SLBB domain